MDNFLSDEEKGIINDTAKENGKKRRLLDEVFYLRTALRMEERSHEDTEEHFALTAISLKRAQEDRVDAEENYTLALAEIQTIKKELEESKRLRWLAEEHYRMARDGRADAHVKLDKIKKAADSFLDDGKTDGWDIVRLIEELTNEQ